MKFEIPMEVNKVYVATKHNKNNKYVYDGMFIYVIRNEKLERTEGNKIGYHGFEDLCNFMNDLGLEEVPQYVTFEEAMNYLDDSILNYARFAHPDFSTTCKYKLANNVLWVANGSITRESKFYVEMLEPKWILL